MEGISFDEEPQMTSPTSRYATTSSKGKGITGLVISLGFAKTESQANVVLIVIVVCSIIIAIAAPLILTGSHGALSPAQRARIMQSTQPPPPTSPY